MPRTFFELKIDNPDYPTSRSLFAEDKDFLKQIGKDHHDAAKERGKPYMEVLNEDGKVLAHFTVWDNGWTEVGP